MLALTQKGTSREDAYRLVQRNAMLAWNGQGDFFALLNKDADVRRHFSESELSELFDPKQHLRHVDTIFARVFGS
jgi:adenylosuccinate lyase